MDFARRFVNSDNDWSNRSLAQLSLQYSYSDLYAATDGFHEKNKIGSGSYGQIYKGLMNDGTEVAIKVIDLPAEAGFEDEVRVLSKFRHPNLVILMGFAVNGSQRLLVYEYLAGGDVSRRLQKCARDNLPFSFGQRVSAALDAACGLSHLHNANPKVFHRDIKTANILLDRNGGAKMADFGLACLSRSNEHKVKQASGTIGYACPYYIQRGVVTEGSEVYSFGMVIIELLCNAPPACAGPNPGEILYLVNHLQGSVSRCVQMADPKANWPPFIANKLAELAMNCVSMNESTRPKFVQIVKTLRHLNDMISNNTYPNNVSPDHPSIVVAKPPLSPRSPPPAAKKINPDLVSPPRQTVPKIDLIKLECVSCSPPQSITHTCSEDARNSLPSFKVGRHCQTVFFDSLVTSETLKGTISREHFVISFQGVTRRTNPNEPQFHATLTNNSINSITVNDKHLEKGQSSFIYSGDTISFLALQQSNSSTPTPFLTLKVVILSGLIQSVRPKPKEVPQPAQPVVAAASATSDSGGSARSLPEYIEDGSARTSPPHSSYNLLNVTCCASATPPPVEAPQQPPQAPPTRVPTPPMKNPSPIHPSQQVPPSFGLEVKGKSHDAIDTLSVKDPQGVLRVGRTYQPESFWRQIAPEACPAISREHFSVSAMRPRSGSVTEEMMLGLPSSNTRTYRFFLNCNSVNGLSVMNPPTVNSVGTHSPVFLQKDSPGSSSFEIFDGSEIELAGSIKLVFRENLNRHNQPSSLTTSTAASGGVSAGRSVHMMPAAPLRPPISGASAKVIRNPFQSASSASASFIGDDEIDFPDDAFSKTGFRAAG